VRHAHAALEGRTLVRDEEAPFYLIAGLTLTIADEFDSADEIWNQAIEGARSRGSIFGFAAGSCFRAYNAFCRGALADAEADARASVDAALSHGLDAGVPAAFLALVLLERGDVEGAAAALDRTPFGEEIPDTNHLYFLLQARGLVRARQGRHAAALDDLRELGRRHASLDGCNPASFSWRSDASLILLEGGEEDEARKLASEEVKLARAWGAPRALGKALRAAGLAAGGDRGLSFLREATEVLEHSQARLEHAYALTELGAALRRRNRRSDARDPLRRGLDLAHSCGATVLAERAHAELAATGTRPRRIALSGVDALTPSEQRVAAMAAEGMTNRDIAQALFVTPKTIEVHLSSVYRKLGISSRSQLDRALATVE
jgi:DNA-binding CsgD family transcriptional regulator